MVGAVNCGLRGVGVLHGYGSREELLDAGAECVVVGVEALKQELVCWAAS